MRRSKFLLAFILLILQELPLCAQQLQRFSVAEFRQDPMDLTARGEHKRTDDNGILYSIIKVKSDLPDDDLQAYHFDFGLMNSFVVHHPEKEELWVYVQKNAKTVSIKREGYIDVDKYDLRTTIDVGCTYVMRLSVTADVVFTQMVQFIVLPVGVRASISVKGIQENAVEELFGQTDETGSVAKNLPFGTYTYRVVAEGYFPSEGRLALNDRAETLTESITLKPNGLPITLRVAADADIYVDNQHKGKREWTGILKTGTHQVECRQHNYHSSKQYISVKEGGKQAFDLSVPTPITGTIAVTSKPLGATISLDGKEVGKTPKNLNDILIGSHTLTLNQSGYEKASKNVDVIESQTAEVSFSLQKLSKEKTAAQAHLERVPIKRPYLRPTSFYLYAGAQIGSYMAGGGGIGTYLKNFNIEAIYLYGFRSSEDITWGDGWESIVCKYRSMSFGGKVGYGISLPKGRFRLTPQAGVLVNSIASTNGKSDGYALSVTTSLRAEFAFNSYFGIFGTPEANIAVMKSDVFSKLVNASSKIKRNATGFNFRIGFYVSF